MHAERVDHDEDDADDGGEEDVDGDGNELLDVSPHFLQPAERFAAALILEHGVGKLERMADAVGIDLRADSLCDDVDVIVLKVLRDTRDEGDANGRRQQQADAPEELGGRVFLEPGRVLVDHVPEDQRVEQREGLIDRGEDERQRHEPPVAFQVPVQKLHGLKMEE